jgi:hypothetical protein
MGFIRLSLKYYSIAFTLFILIGIWTFQNRQGEFNDEILLYVYKHGPEPFFNEINGSYSEVAEYLQQVAINPDSVKINSCTKAKETDKGWFVRCKYTAKNKRGAVAEGSNGFYISNNKVILREK